MRRDVHEEVSVSDDPEIESPVAVYSCLPKIIGAFIFLGAQRRMVKVGEKKTSLLPERPLHRRGRQTKTSVEALGKDELHQSEAVRLGRLDRFRVLS